MLRKATAHLYEGIAFITGFALMAYELVASRLLAPTIGSSTYVWTSVIGVIIAALSLGYAAGGWVADKRVAKQDIAWLLIASAGTVLGTLLFSGTILNALSNTLGDERIQGILASLILFAPTSFILGMISPYLVRLRIDSLSTTGRSVAGLSALNSVGGIVGTLCTGFIFFGHIGSRETLGLILVILLIASWLIVPHHRIPLRIGISLGLICIALLNFGPSLHARTVANIDTPASHYIIVDTFYNGQDVRALAMGPHGLQSGVYRNDPDTLVFTYTQAMADAVAAAPRKKNILILGGGAFTLPQHLAKQHPDSQIDVVEIDAALPGIARQYFGYTDPANVHIITEDARAFIQTNKKTYDLILIDVFSDISVPFAVTTQEYTRALKQSVTSQGAIIANIIGASSPQCTPLLGAMHSAYLQHFNNYRAYPLVSTDLQTRQNILAIYSNKALRWTNALEIDTATLPTGQKLTDNFAPVERLRQQCY